MQLEKEIVVREIEPTNPGDDPGPAMKLCLFCARGNSSITSLHNTSMPSLPLEKVTLTKGVVSSLPECVQGYFCHDCAKFTVSDWLDLDCVCGS